MDISIQAIEGLLNQAQANAGRPVATEALMRAQILATLLNAGYSTEPPRIDLVPEPNRPREDVSFTGLIDATETDDDDDVEDLFGDAPKR